MSQDHQATCVAINGRAVLIEGAPGSGKSSLALALIDRGAMLVGDDSVLLEVRDDRLYALPHPNTRGLLEVRNLGLLPYPVCAEAPVALVIILTPDAARFVEEPATDWRCGIALPVIALEPHVQALPLRAELALARYGTA